MGKTWTVMYFSFCCVQKGQKIKNMSWWHIFFEKMVKNLNFDLFRPFLGGPKRPENVVPKGHGLNTLKSTSDMLVNQVSYIKTILRKWPQTWNFTPGGHVFYTH